jgi:uncharacterized protein involved in type VI secretion and phage assembly
MSGQEGVVTAVVATDPDSQGRLGLRFHWLPNGETLEPVYAPVAAALAGGTRGAWLMPEQGDEVLVAFDRGCWDRPFVVGFLWNGSQAPPETDRRNRVIVTPGGHTLRFEDGDAKRVILRTAGGSGKTHSITLDDQARKVVVHSANGHELTLDDSAGSVTLGVAGGATTVTLDAQSATVRGGGHSVTLSSSGVAIT